MTGRRILVCALLVVPAGACVSRTDRGEGTSAVSGAASAAGVNGKDGGCGGEAAAGGYMKAGGTWDGTAGNAYGYPSGHVGQDCAGFGFHDTCDFWESCSYYCSVDDECPAGGETGPVAVCQTNDKTKEMLCVLPCGDAGACPEGMQCVLHPYGFGEICMWKRSFG